MKKGRASFVINPQTQSEINLAVEFQESSKLSPYIDRFISTTVLIDKPMDATIGLVKSIGSIKELPPNPLANGMGTKMELIKKIDCK